MKHILCLTACAGLLVPMLVSGASAQSLPDAAPVSEFLSHAREGAVPAVLEASTRSLAGGASTMPWSWGDAQTAFDNAQYQVTAATQLVGNWGKESAVQLGHAGQTGPYQDGGDLLSFRLEGGNRDILMGTARGSGPSGASSRITIRPPGEAAFSLIQSLVPWKTWGLVCRMTDQDLLVCDALQGEDQDARPGQNERQRWVVGYRRLAGAGGRP